MERAVTAKRARPETLQQARTWERTKGRYLAAGLCHACAAQAAWGHQCGFTGIKPPCAACTPLVAAFPTPAVAPWRKLLRQNTRFPAHGGAVNVAGSIPRSNDTPEAPDAQDSAAAPDVTPSPIPTTHR